MNFYIAGPLFNEPQVEWLKEIEDLLTRKGHSYYSPRRDSGSAQLSPEDRQDPAKWQEVFDRNVNAIHTCNYMICVMDYLLLEGQEILLRGLGNSCNNPTPISLPDIGTVWEAGYARAIYKPLIALYREPPKRLNLMLSFGFEATIVGLDNLDKFLNTHGWDKPVDNKMIPDSVILRCKQILEANPTASQAANWKNSVWKLNWEAGVTYNPAKAKTV